MNTPRANAFDVFGLPYVVMPVRDVIENDRDSGQVLLVGPNVFQEDFRIALRDEYRREFGELGDKYFGRYASRFVTLNNEQGEVSLANQKHAALISQSIATYKKTTKKDWDKLPVRLILILWPCEPDDVKYLSTITQRHPEIPTYILWQEGTELREQGVFERTATPITLKSTPIEQIKATVIEWVPGCEGYLPRGMVGTLIAPKTRGKTKICDWFTNRVVKAEGKVLRMNLEDPADCVLRPGIYAAGVTEEGAVEIMDAQQSIDLSDPAYITALRAKVAKEKFDLIIIEPLNNYKGQKKSISEDDMRPIYTALSENICVPTGVMILVINHTNKRKDAADALEKNSGAQSNVNVARVNWFLEKDDDCPEHRLFMNAGSNIPVGKNMVFTIESVPTFTLDGVELKDIGRAVFKEFTDKSANEVVERAQSENRGDSARIAEFLKEFLADKGEVDVDQVKLAARNHNSEWKWDNIKQVYSRRRIGKSRTMQVGKTKKTFWSLDGQARFPEQHVEAGGIAI